MHRLAPLLLCRLVIISSLFEVFAQNADNRCFLESGGSAESFFVSEDLPVGATLDEYAGSTEYFNQNGNSHKSQWKQDLEFTSTNWQLCLLISQDGGRAFSGVIRIVGELGERGNIELRLQESDSPVRITPNSKNLTLTRKLDKEGIEGPSSVYVNIICDRKRTSDPGFVIPVNIRVTDANDNAPQFINAPYVLNISEVTVVGTRVLQGVKALDADQQGPFSTVQYSVLPGPHSDYFVFINGLEGTLVLRKALDYETLSNFTLLIRAQDQGSPPQWTDTKLYVNVIDADDQNPKFYHDHYTATLPDLTQQGTKLKIFPEEVGAYDQDIGINAPVFYTFNADALEYRYFEVDRTDAHITTKRAISEDELLQPVTIVIKATQFDNADRYALATLTVARPGSSTRDLTFLQSHYYAGVLENTPINSVLLTVVTNKPRNKRIRYWLSEYESMFQITPSGDIILLQALDYETEELYTFNVHASDTFSNATCFVNITVLNVNDWDPRFRYPQYEFFLTDDALVPGSIVGKVEAADGDKNDYITLSLRGPAAKMFSVNDEGIITLCDVTAFNSSTVHLVAVATDSGIPPRQASVPVIVHVPGVMVGGWTTRGPGFVTTVVFGTTLSVLALIIILLLAYIHKNKKQKSATRLENNMNKFGGFVASPVFPEKVVGIGKMENPVFNGGRNTSPSQFSTATVKSIMSPNRMAGSQMNSSASHRLKQKIAPAPPQVPKLSTPSPPHTRTLWPPGSFPRRVKKLSWNDESDSYQRRADLDSEVNSSPLALENNKGSEHMNLTVYF